MKTGTLGAVLRHQRGSATIALPERTGLYDTAQDNLGMVTAYLLDGDSFLAAGDPVNALAAFSYGLGWLHCGAACGFFSLQERRCPLGEPVDPLPAPVQAALSEKTYRYRRLLGAACAAVTPAPETGTVPCRTAERVHAVASLYAEQGGRYRARGRREDALYCFSYGHGWLDAGVRAGLFAVRTGRDLFTI